MSLSGKQIVIAGAWEAAFAESKLPDQRGVIMRTSFVVGRDRGADSGFEFRFPQLDTALRDLYA